MMKKIVVGVFCVACCSILFAQNKVSVASPGKELIFTFALVKGHPEYSVIYKDKRLVENSMLGLTFYGDDFFGNDIKTVATGLAL